MSKPEHGIADRDLLGQAAVDYEQRVDMTRLARERLARLQAAIATADFGAVLLHDPLNIRYATGRRLSGGIYMRWSARAALVPREGRPIYLGTAFDPVRDRDLVQTRPYVQHAYFWCGRNIAEGARRWAASIVGLLNERGLSGERLGFDRIEHGPLEALSDHGIRLADAQVPIAKARAIKTVDEIALIRQACAIGDIAAATVQRELKPGATENELFALLAATNLKHGGEYMDCRLLAAGGNTKPWGRTASDRLVRPGDLVGFDTDMVGPMGYMCDISRTYLCGDTRPTRDQRDSHQVAYDFLLEAISLCRPGASLSDIAARAPVLPEDFREASYGILAHGTGMSDEWPVIWWPDDGRVGGFRNDPDVLEENMVLSVESLVSKAAARECVKLEEQIIVTASGPVVISQAPFDQRLVD